MFYWDSYHLERRDVKWVVLSGLTAGAFNVLNVCAVRPDLSVAVVGTPRLAGAHVGSIGALCSVNTITAALVGHFMLGEAFGRLNLLALLLAIGGAVLIWDGTPDSTVVGNALALVAGVCSGCSIICARKAGKASSLILG